ncbi:unnamed protein product [Litomosoides sigmodontis]|uniref:Uncharacterized protein n=1 Tax=Litomosoides sigmodontis TaxID=42156 RepID=A0A3P6UAU8_LITSI|nr:unnamed protein product [Litomosoides sigmodontis]
MCFSKIWPHSQATKRRKKYCKKGKTFQKNEEKHHKSERKGDKSIEEKIKKESINEAGKEEKARQLLHRYNNQQEEDNKLNKLRLSYAHYQQHQKATYDRAVSPDNTLREITDDMPNIELKHVSSNETIYTNDELM